MARRKTLSAIQDEQLGFKEKPDYLTVKVMVRSIPHDRSVVYPACPNVKEDGRKCQKKLIQGVDGWSCESCNRVVEAPEYRYIFNMEVMDYSGSQYVQLFNDEGERFFEIPAGRMNELEKSNSEEYEKVFKNRLFKEYIMTLRVKVDQSMTSRVRCTVYRFDPVDVDKEVDDLASLLDSMQLD
ncbi:uncharacterized protein [Blastocystis hominis]|uniref:Replication factor A C-terminal domain-containing protein n=1 Tax=Blastocystis hominis TaxID=12968 RepID=D8LWF8_BLAHO|nr:uncharacterized protein [Blastocystis hominis]CBK20147.2 unnamed protein product [Blastocystis hominis]|eukprot:XP_012894195.1 uncharacterized protein [Blastocystis hominis]